MRRARAARTLRTGLLATAAAGVLALAGPGPASAHNVVVGTTPGADETVTTAPDEVSVTFDDVVLNVSADGSSTAIQVTGPDGGEHADGCAATQDRTISVPVVVDDPGTYTVAWRVVSADGHPTSGEFSFTYAPDGEQPDATTAGGDAATPAGCDPGTQEEDAGATGAPDDASGRTAGEEPAAGAGGSSNDTTGGSDLPVVLGIAGGVVVLAGAGVLLALRLGRRQH